MKLHLISPNFYIHETWMWKLGLRPGTRGWFRVGAGSLFTAMCVAGRNRVTWEIFGDTRNTYWCNWEWYEINGTVLVASRDGFGLLHSRRVRSTSLSLPLLYSRWLHGGRKRTAIIIFSWDILHVFSGIVSTWTLPSCDKAYVYVIRVCWSGGGCWVVLETIQTIFCRTSTLSMWPETVFLNYWKPENIIFLGFAPCHFRAKKNLDFQDPSILMVLKMDLPASKSLHPAQLNTQLH